MFIKIRTEVAALVDPQRVVEAIIDSIVVKKQANTRYTQYPCSRRFTARLLPVLAVCVAKVPKFQEVARPLIEARFVGKENVTVSVMVYIGEVVA